LLLRWDILLPFIIFWQVRTLLFIMLICYNLLLIYNIEFKRYQKSILWFSVRCVITSQTVPLDSFLSVECLLLRGPVDIGIFCEHDCLFFVRLPQFTRKISIDCQIYIKNLFKLRIKIYINITNIDSRRNNIGMIKSSWIGCQLHHSPYISLCSHHS